MEDRVNAERGRHLELIGDRVDVVGDAVWSHFLGYLDSVRRGRLRVERQTLSSTCYNHP